MKYSIDIAVQHPAWEGVEKLESFTEDVITRTLSSAEGYHEIGPKPLEVSVVFANDDTVQVLNREYRGKDKPTNILSFAMLDAETNHETGVVALGDLVLAYETIEHEAKESSKLIKDHLAHLLIHGTLHLLGYDHIEEDDATVMESLEIRILEKLNIQNPYTQAL